MGIGCLIYDIKELAPGPDGRVPEIMVVAPPPMLEDIGEWSGIFDGAQSKSLELAHAFEVISDSLEVHFFDAARIISSDPADGFHLSKQAHEDLGKAIANEVEAIGWGV
jgi:lysophospholipase L1-like esterase